jgi:hypothetical protein
MGWGHLKIFFSTRLITNYPWGNGIQVSSNEGGRPSPMGDNSERVKVQWTLKIPFWRTTELEKLKFTWKRPDMVQIQVCENHDLPGSGGATIWETVFTCVYIGKKYLKNLLKNHRTKRAEIYMIHVSLWHISKLSLLRSWPHGVECGHIRGNSFCMFL